MGTTERACACIGGAAIVVAAFGWTTCAAPLGAPAAVATNDPGWISYLNARFGLRVDLPGSGFRQELSPNGSGLTLSSRDHAITIAVHANWLTSILPQATGNAGTSIAALHDRAIAETRQKGGSVDYSVRRNDFYVISGKLGSTIYYERVTISPACPDVFNAIRLKYPQAIERELDGVVSRVSLSLRAACPTQVE